MSRLACDEFVDFEDGDTCTDEELSQLFTHEYQMVHERKISQKGSYCLHMSSDAGWDYIAVANSDSTVNIVRVDTMQPVSQYQEHFDSITQIYFSPHQNDLVYTSSLDGTVKLFDRRANKIVKELAERSSGHAKPLTCFDITSNERFLCAGTELMVEDAFLLFWDIREGRSLGGYWESHADAITNIKFCDKDPCIMASSGTDGLVNIYDISQDKESEALLYTLNSGAIIDQLYWYCKSSKHKKLIALSDEYSVQYWNVKKTSPTFEFSCEHLADAVRRKEPSECYSVFSACYNGVDDPLIVVGFGAEKDNGCLRVLAFSTKTGILVPYGRFVRKKCESAMWPRVRSCIRHSRENVFINAGEDGKVCLWKGT